MKRLLIGPVVLAGMLAGTPYVALAVHHLMGTRTVELADAGGARRILTSGPGVMQPQWLPRLTDAMAIKSFHWQPARQWTEAGGQELLSRAPVETIKSHYRAELARLGFAVEEFLPTARASGTGPAVGAAATLIAERRETGHQISVRIGERTAATLYGPRLVQIDWCQVGAGQAGHLAAYRAVQPSG